MKRYDWISALKKRIRQTIKPPLHTVEIKVPYIVLGTEYGGWPFIKDSLDSNSLVYSFGVGEDLSFDLDLIARTGATVHAFDPTPKSIRWVQTQGLPRQLNFHPLGIGARDGCVPFFPPENESHVSFSVAPRPDRVPAEPHMAEVLTLGSIGHRLGHRVPDCIKMDVEGFEYEVITKMIEEGVLPSVLLIEFHHGMYGVSDKQTESAVDQLRAHGYRIFYISGAGREYGFVSNKAPQAPA